jgi:hypothetical protein
MSACRRLRLKLDHVGKGQRLMRVDEARVHLRDRPGNALDRAAHDANLSFSRGLGAKSSCKIKNMQRRWNPCTIEIETHWVKGKSGTQSGTVKLRLGYLWPQIEPASAPHRWKGRWETVELSSDSTSE